MNIALLSHLHTLNASYRVMPIAELVSHGHNVLLIDGQMDRATEDRLFRFDAVYMQRAHTRGMLQLARRLADAGVAVVWDNDDNLAVAPEISPHAVKGGALKQQRMRHEIARMVKAADLVTTTSPELKTLYESLGADRVVIVENYIPPAFGLPSRQARKRERVVVGWVAAGEHRIDAEELGISETVRGLLSEDSRLSMVSVGVDLRIDSDRYRHVPHVGYQELGSQISDFDIGIAPLADHPFNRARSDVKLKEYAFAGVPWLASPTGPYAAMGQDEGGRLVDDGSWRAELQRLIGSPRDRKRLGKRGMRWAKTKTATANAAVWEAVFVEAAERASSRRALARA